MAALSLWVRRKWVRRWPGLLGLGLLIAVVGGVTLAVTAGARRTSSAFTRLETATNAPSVQVELAEGADPVEAMYADMPSPASLADLIDDVPGVEGVAVASFMGATPDPDGSWFGIVNSESRGRAPGNRLLAGRLPDPDVPAEIVVNEAGAKEWHTGVGRTLQIHTLARDQLRTFAGMAQDEPRGPVIDATVVGIVRGIEDVSDVPEAAFGAGPGFLRRWGDDIAHLTAVALVKVEPDRTAEVIEALNDRLGPRLVASATVDRDDFASRVSNTIDVDVAVLTIFAIAAALAGLLVIGQALARTVAGHEPEEESLAALGMTRPEGTIALVGAVAPAVIIGVVGAIVLAAALSPVFPTGLARRADPTSGVRLDAPVLFAGGITFLAALMALAAITSWLTMGDRFREARRPNTSRLGIAGRVASVLPAVPSLGTTFALAPGPRRRAVGGLAGIVGAAVLVGGAVGVATVERSRHTLLSTSALYGANWDYELGLDGVDPATVLPAIADDPDVVALGTRSQLLANGGDLNVRGPNGSYIVGPMAHSLLKGSIPPVIGGGRAPGPGEAAIGRRLGHQLGVGLGDSIVVEGYRGDVPLVVTGWFINAGEDDLDRGLYVARETLDTFTRQRCADDTNLACTVTDEGAGLVVRPGARREEVARRLTAIAPDLVPVSPPSAVANLQEVGTTPWLLAAFLVLIGSAGLAHALIVGVRQRRRDLAVVRAIGLRPRQARRVISWQAFVMAAAGAVIGLLVGLLVARLVWERIATGIGAIVRVNVPLAALVLAPALAIALGLALAFVTGRRASVLRPAVVLRAE